MIHWDDLKYLLAVKEHGNLVNAAKMLKANPTTVSRHIKRLAETYEQTLFSRTGNGEWQLTPQGLAFANVAETCRREITSLTELSLQNDTPQVKISALEFIVERFLAPSIGDMLKKDNGVQLTLDAEDRNVSLAFGEADLAIRMARPTSGRLIASKVGEVAMSVFNAGGRRTKNWVGLPEEFDWVPEMKMGLEFFGRPPSIRMGTFSSIRRVALESGLSGVGPDKMVTEWSELSILHPPSKSVQREVWCVFHESRRSDKSLLAAREWVKTCFDSPRRTQSSQLCGVA